MASHKNTSRGLPRGRGKGLTAGPGNIGGGVTINGGLGQGPAVVKSGGTGNRSANLPTRVRSRGGPAIRSTPGRTVAGTGRTLPS